MLAVVAVALALVSDGLALPAALPAPLLPFALCPVPVNPLHTLSCALSRVAESQPGASRPVRWAVDVARP